MNQPIFLFHFDVSLSFPLSPLSLKAMKKEVSLGEYKKKAWKTKREPKKGCLQTKKTRESTEEKVQGKSE